MICPKDRDTLDAPMIEEDELIGELTAVVHGLVADGELELVSRNGASAVATQLARVLEENPDVDLEAWLVDLDEVVELYADAETLARKMQPVMHRLAHGDPPPKWDDEVAASVLRDPDDLQARLVFADWLQQEGDPRGELVVIQTELLRASQDGGSDRDTERWKAQERSLLRRFRTRFLGSLENAEGVQLLWKCGYLDEARISGVHLDDLLRLESSRLLRKLEVPNALGEAGACLARSPAPKTLRELRLGVVDSSNESDNDGSIAIESVAADGLSSLERLDLAAEAVRLGAPLPRLEHLRIDARRLDLTSGALSRCPRLEHLELYLRSAVEAEQFGSWFEPLPPRLHRLRLTAKGYGGFPFLELLTAPLMKQLRSLDLRGSSFRSGDAATFLQNAELVAHLECLDLRGLRLGAGEAAGLGKLCASVLLGDDPEARLEVDEDYDDDEHGEDDDHFDDPRANEDIFHGEEETDDPDEEADDLGEPPGVDKGAPLAERLVDDDEV